MHPGLTFPTLISASDSLEVAHRQVCEKHAMLRSGITVVQQDMLKADLSTTGILFLTSQCWDTALMEKVVTKIGAELPGVVLVHDGD